MATTSGQSDGSSAERLLTEAELAKLLRVSHECLRRWRYAGRGPSFVRLLDRLVRYRLCDVHAWMDKQQGGNAA